MRFGVDDSPQYAKLRLCLEIGEGKLLMRQTVDRWHGDKTIEVKARCAARFANGLRNTGQVKLYGGRIELMDKWRHGLPFTEADFGVAENSAETR